MSISYLQFLHQVKGLPMHLACLAAYVSIKIWSVPKESVGVYPLTMPSKDNAVSLCFLILFYVRYVRVLTSTTEE